MRAQPVVFVCACLGMFLFGASLITLGSVAPLLRERFSMDAIAAGTLFSILPIGILTGSILFGPLSDRFGYKLILIVSTLLISIGFQGVAWASSLPLLRTCIFLFGLGGGAVNGATNALVSDISESNKGADLSLLGVFFAVGALGMPFVLGTLQDRFNFSLVISAIGCIPIAAAIIYVFVHFPLPKQPHGVPFAQSLSLLKDKLLIAIGFFLFGISSFEAIINNWTTTYLTTILDIPLNNALFALSIYVMGMAVTRIVIGSALRNVATDKILLGSFLILLAGCIVLHTPESYTASLAGLVLIGVGMAAGFPLMLGVAGSLHPARSGSAFSVVLTIALIGNMTVNFVMGIVAEKFGISHLSTMTFVLLSGLLFIALYIFRNKHNKPNPSPR